MRIKNIKKEIVMLITYNFIGLINTAIDFGLFFVFVHWFHIPITLSQIFSYSGGTINSYFMNRKLTFKSNKTVNLKEFISFIVINVFSLTISALVLNGMIALINGNLLISKIVATCFSMIINYLGQRCFTFRRRECEND